MFSIFFRTTAGLNNAWFQQTVTSAGIALSAIKRNQAELAAKTVRQ